MAAPADRACWRPMSASGMRKSPTTCGSISPVFAIEVPWRTSLMITLSSSPLPDAGQSRRIVGAPAQLRKRRRAPACLAFCARTATINHGTISRARLFGAEFITCVEDVMKSAMRYLLSSLLAVGLLLAAAAHGQEKEKDKKDKDKEKDPTKETTTEYYPLKEG